jgi:acyl-CoA hydrolase
MHLESHLTSFFLENLQTGEINFTNDGFFTITAVDKELVPVVIPRVIPQTQAEVDMYEEGNERRNKRLLHRKELLDLLDHLPSSPTTTK